MLGIFIQVKFVIDSLRGLQLVVGNYIQVKFGIDSLRRIQLQHAVTNHAVQGTLAYRETKFLAEQVLRSEAGAWA